MPLDDEWYNQFLSSRKAHRNARGKVVEELEKAEQETEKAQEAFTKAKKNDADFTGLRKASSDLTKAKFNEQQIRKKLPPA
jgi:uncharacterized protein (DUF3084 family)